MTGNDLKKLSRRELVDVIYQLKKSEQLLQEKIDALESALQDKRIRISEDGSIAEASTRITDIFSAAQSTADIYLNEIKAMKADTEKECERILEDAKKKAKDIISESEIQLLRTELHKNQDSKNND